MKSISTHDFTNDGYWAILSLRAVSVITSISVIISLAWAAHTRRNLQSNVDLGGAFDYMVLGASAYSLLYSFSAFIIRLHLRRPIHPGMYIAFDLIGFVVLSTMTVMFWVIVQPYDRASYCSVNGVSVPCEAGTLATVELFAASMATITCAIHLTSLFWSCWACYRYQNWESKETASVRSSSC